MLLRALGAAAMFGGRMGLRAAGPTAKFAAGFGYGAAAGGIGLAAAAGYVGYKAIRGGGALHTAPLTMNPMIQARAAAAALGGGAAYGEMTRQPAYRADYSPGGNLESKSQAMLNATGDLALSLNRNARGVPAPTQFGYMTTTSIPGNGRF
jgi:hypothetical protein